MAKKESEGNAPQRRSGGSSGGMKVFFAGFLTGVAMTILCGWYFYIGRHDSRVKQAQNATASAIRQATALFETKLEAWHLTVPDIEQEFNKTGKVVRRQAREFGTAIADTASDAKITATIKTKLKLDRDLRGAEIVVSTTDGRVTLSGNVPSLKLVGARGGTGVRHGGRPGSFVHVEGEAAEWINAKSPRCLKKSASCWI